MFIPVREREFVRVTVHGVLLSGQEFDQSPEGVLFVHVDEQQSGDLTHALAVAHLLQTHNELIQTLDSYILNPPELLYFLPSNVTQHE